MEPSAATTETLRNAVPLAAPNKLRARMLIAAALALVGCRLLSLRHSVAGMAAGGIVMIALMIAVIVSSPRLRRWMFWLTLPLAVATNAATLAIGLAAAWMGSQGLLPGGRLGIKVPWTPLFWCVPFAAAVTLCALAKSSGHGFSNRRGAALLANLVTTLVTLWYWANHEAQVYPNSPPPLGAVLLLAVAAISFATLFWEAPRSNTTMGRRRSGWWRVGFVVVAASPIVAAIVVAFLPIYHHRRDVAELESLGFTVSPGRRPRWARPFDDVFPTYDYLANVDSLDMRRTAEVSAADAERIEQLLARQPTLSWLSVANIQPGGGKLLRSLAGGRFLTHLALTGPGVTDETLTDVASLPALVHLNLLHSSITDDGLAGLAKLPTLEGIDLSGTKISGRGLSQLASLPKLWAIELSDVPLDDRDLLALERYPALRVLNLQGTRVTDEGIARLRQALPRLGGVNVTLGPIMPGATPAVPAVPASAPQATAPAPPQIGQATDQSSETSVKP